MDVSNSKNAPVVDGNGVDHDSDSSPQENQVPNYQSLLGRAFGSITSAFDWVFGLLCLLLGLALVSVIPIVQFVSLGVLLDVSARVATSGRVRDGFRGVRAASRVGGIVLGTWLMILPLRVISEMAYSAHLIDPDGTVAEGWRTGLGIATIVMAMHIFAAWLCGGRLRHFFWPLLIPFTIPVWWVRSRFNRAHAGREARSFVGRIRADIAAVRPLNQWFVPAMIWHGLRHGGLWREARDATWSFFESLPFKHYFWLGLRGATGALVWLIVPITLLIAASTIEPPAGVLIGILGAGVLAYVLIYLPFLQTQFAIEDRWSAMFERAAMKRRFRHAPIVFWFSLLVTLLFAVPLYLLKVEVTPSEVAVLPSVVFVAFIFPARLLTGWAIHRSGLREDPRHPLICWTSRLASLPIVGGYIVIVFLTQYTSWHGVGSLFEQHAFLLPVPFLEM